VATLFAAILAEVTLALGDGVVTALWESTVVGLAATL
jgi:hypothetical protein